MLLGAGPAWSAGLLKPRGASDAAGVIIRSHHVDVVINNGFCRTEVDQVFGNSTDADFEAIYTLPLPKKSSLSEVSLWIDGREVIGEVVEKERARQIYEEQVAKGHDTALAEKNDFMAYEINVGRVPAGGETRVRAVYYQPLEIDLNVGRYVYPLAEGGVDDERIAFWAIDDRVAGPFRFRLLLKSVFPVRDVRVPGYEAAAQISRRAGEQAAAGTEYDVLIDRPQGGNLDRDIIFYYRLDDTVPARVELLPYRASGKEPGTVMVVVTPAASLKRIEEGTDWIFVLDVSGSMAGDKIATLADAVVQVLGKMSENDRFRIVTFNEHARELTSGYVAATPPNVNNWIARVRAVRAGGGTALYAGLAQGYRCLDADRTSGVILVTDAVCNVGPTQHGAFLKLLREYDVRLFTFVIGNSANQPLAERLACDSGGFAMNISDADDMVGRLLQAKAKVLHECMHDVKLTLRGASIEHLTPPRLGNLYMGQQVVVFGRYADAGEVEIDLSARISGERKRWSCSAALPQVDTDNPELERLWALSRIDDVMEQVREHGESEKWRRQVVDLGLEYSLVTDYTSMLVLREEVMEELGLDRRNAARVHRERTAQQARLTNPARNRRVDQGQNTFEDRSAPGVGTGPVGLLLAGLLAILGWRRRR
ncbi:MAG: VWA domain-containing protein [Kiritimatiellae bacterium]|nr:VWA domain-containing protein [Kiritimatiellia bacterium]